MGQSSQAVITESGEFLTLLEESLLLTKDQWSELQATISYPTTAQQIAQMLLAKKWVTRWHCKQLLQGQTDFFIFEGKYKKLEMLGQGGMGSVYKAQNTRTQQIIALKILNADSVENEEAKARFQREIVTVLSMKNHPNVVAAHGADWKDDLYIFEMEYVPGHTLSQWLHRYGPLPIPWAVECIKQAALGLQHAHEHKIVHRDVKPGNILVVSNDIYSVPHAKILDLGLARVTDPSLASDQNRQLTRQGQVLGTPIYMAPEQAMNTREADIRADLYSLGCTLYRMISGQYPFEGTTPVDQIRARLEKPTPHVIESRSDVSPELDAVIAKVMDKDPNARYSTPLELAQALEPHSMTDSVELSNQALLAEQTAEETPSTASSITMKTELNEWDVDSHITFVDPAKVNQAVQHTNEVTLVTDAPLTEAHVPITVQVNPPRKVPVWFLISALMLGVAIVVLLISGLMFTPNVPTSP